MEATTHANVATNPPAAPGAGPAADVAVGGPPPAAIAGPPDTSAAPVASAAAATSLAAPKPAPQTDPHLTSWTVPLASIDAAGSPFRFRRELRPDARTKELAASIDTQGLLHPLTVRKVGGAFQLVSGFRRHAALTYLANTKGADPAAMPVRVSVLPEGSSDDAALTVSFDENLARKTLDATEKAIAALKLRDEFGKTMEEIGALVRLTPRQLQRLVGVMGAPQDVREAFRQGRFGLRHALAIAGMPDAGARKLMIDRAKVLRLRQGASRTNATQDAAPSAAAPAPFVPEGLRGFVRVIVTESPTRPFRVSVQLPTEEATQKLIKYLVRLVG
ncbi:MAG TPA: ParB/RepB/Spo0J family partition protein [Planctomycetota bacterium]|nr:ParB/RepB/Spo0J family partition protein [Planctomycetota bacterium]